jgi:threonine/homoserine efflux transporter RhtA
MARRATAPAAARRASPTHAPPSKKGLLMNMQLSLAPIIALLAGILILVQPKLLNYIVAIYLIVIGLLGLFGAPNLHMH